MCCNRAWDLVDSLLAVPKGPPSTIQSLRSINDTFHAIGGGDLDLLEEKTLGSGAVVFAEGENGELTRKPGLERDTSSVTTRMLNKQKTSESESFPLTKP